MYKEKLENHKNKLMENIKYGKSVGINKVSAILMIEDDQRHELEKDIISWLIEEGYKVSVTRDEVKVLSIEW